MSAAAHPDRDRGRDRGDDGPPLTEDGHHVVIDGRKWRATDPEIPDERRSELQRVLMAWRREVGRVKRTGAGEEAEATARAGVQAAKVALGERGTPWWEQSSAERRRRWETEVRAPISSQE